MAIDVGGDLGVRAGGSYTNETTIVLDNPANASGTIDTINFQVREDVTNIRFGIFYLVSGTDYKCRSSTPDQGAFLAGVRQITGLSLAIVTGDFIGTYTTYSSGVNPIERDGTGFAGTMYSSGEHIDVDDQATYGLNAGDILSLNGTGTESGGGWAGEFGGVLADATDGFDGVAIDELDGV